MLKIDDKILKVKETIDKLNKDYERLIAEKALEIEKEKEKLRALRTPQQLELSDIRNNIKDLVDKYNDIAQNSAYDTKVALFTYNGQNIYVLDEYGENEYKEYFPEYDNINKHPNYQHWYPSSTDC